LARYIASPIFVRSQCDIIVILDASCRWLWQRTLQPLLQTMAGVEVLLVCCQGHRVHVVLLMASPHEMHVCSPAADSKWQSQKHNTHREEVQKHTIHRGGAQKLHIPMKAGPIKNNTGPCCISLRAQEGHVDEKHPKTCNTWQQQPTAQLVLNPKTTAFA